MPFKLFGKLGLDGKAFQSGMNRAKKSVTSLGAKMKGIGGKMGGILKSGAGMLGIGVGAAVIGQQIKQTVEWGGKIQDLSEKFGVTTGFIQEMDYAFSQTGMTIEEGMGSFKNMQIYMHRTLSKFRGEQRREELGAAFKMLGVTVKDVENLKPDQLFLKIARALEYADANSQGLQEALNTVFGGSGNKLLVTFGAGVDGLREKFRNLGATIDEETIMKLAEAGEKMAEIDTRWQAFKSRGIGAAFERYDTEAAEWEAQQRVASEALSDSIIEGNYSVQGVLNAASGILGAVGLGGAEEWLGIGYKGEALQAARKDIANEQAAKEKKKEDEKTERKKKRDEQLVRQQELVEKQKAETEEQLKAAAQKQKKEGAAAKRLTAWTGFKGDKLEKIGGRMGMATTQLNIGKQQLALMVKAQEKRTQLDKNVAELRNIIINGG